ncbi:pyridoxamine 5'-phosphate oxidase family protein [Methylovirgula sp. 4M-Z18]|uniref:pyridoxamine 5'-phosphate oxidase family protein n=1 Tax=Methylovirgula sp. 4M-Z18 TaxID=2293567 RepID=UPI000E2E44AF|nr:pyridoxamine 5'-phosphate oxidase family protein [Methylovirgula sp. 4M-Z18]RFB80809.1 pyridoxamine 5'-phosphate oxidase [Methylovirgula sp. 4M-Z18]
MSHAIASDIAFTPAVKAIQSTKGSRAAYAQMEQGGGWRREVTPDFAAFIAAQNSFFFATASADNQPYIQHRGGPKGFLHVLDAKTLAFADYRGNRQYITLGNLSENPKAYMFLMDWMLRQRIKIWGRARVIEDDPALLERVRPEGYKALPERVIVFAIEAWDANCPQHIPQKFDAEDVARVLTEKDAKIAALELQLADLRGGVR